MLSNSISDTGLGQQNLWLRHLVTPLHLAIALACALSMTTIWLATIQRMDAEREQAMAAAMESNADLAMAFEKQIALTLESAEQIAALVRKQYLEQGARFDLKKTLDKDTLRKPVFSVISIVNERGDTVSSNADTSKAINYADREFFQAQRDAKSDKLFISKPVLGRISGEWQIPLALRINRPNGNFAGVVVMAVAPLHFTDFYSVANLGKDGLLELTGLDGVVRGRKVGDENSFGTTAEKLPWFQRRATTAHGSVVVDGQELDGVPRVVSYRTMRDYPLMVGVGTAQAEELALTEQRGSGYLLAASAASTVLMLLVILLLITLARQRATTDILRGSEQLFRATFHQAAMGIVHLAPNGRILLVNEKFGDMLGYRPDELSNRSVFDLSAASEYERVAQFLLQQLTAPTESLAPEIEKTYLHKSGQTLWVYEALGVVHDARGEAQFMVAVSQDITLRKELEARLAYDAHHDALTGLPNRLLFRSRLLQVLESARRYHHAAAVLYVDLDGFKAVNDSYGHAAGDALLQEVARRMERCVRAEDTVARFGGDEFGVALANIAAKDDCALVAAKLLDALAEPVHLEGGVLAQVSGSIGAALFPEHGTDITMLLAHADAAMYAAKKAGKNQFCWEGVVEATFNA